MEKVNVMSVILALAAVALGIYLVSLFAGSRYGPMLGFVLIAIAILGFPLAILVKRGDLVFLGLALIFLSEGIYYIYLVSPWGSGEGDTFFSKLLGFSVLGTPIAILCFSIFFLWSWEKSGSRIFELAQYGICVLLHIVNFGVAMLYPWSEITRFGGAGLAIIFGILNFIRLLKP